MPESSEIDRREMDRLNARIAELEQRIARLSQSESPVPPAPLFPPAVLHLETGSEYPGHPKAELQADFAALEQRIEAKLQLMRKAEQQLAASQKAFEAHLQATAEGTREAADRCLRSVAKALVEIEHRTKTNLQEITSASVQSEIEKHRVHVEDIFQAAMNSLQKSAESCQAKAQEKIQGQCDKTLETTATALQEKAAGVSQLFASQLDHFSRSFADHTKRLIEEGAMAQAGRWPEQLKHAEEEIRASFEAGLRNASRDYRRHLDELTAAVLDEAKARLAQVLAEQDTQFHLNAAQGAADFQEQLAQCTATATEEAMQGLDLRASGLIEKMSAEAEKRRAIENERWKEGLEESLAQFKQSLEYASNSWRAATVALLMQDTQRLKDKVAAGLMYGLQQSAVKGCVELARVLSQKSIGQATSLKPDSSEDKEKNSK